jgi:phosphoglycolate phosphatase
MRRVSRAAAGMSPYDPSLTLLFDLDGTLVDTAPDLCAALNAVLAADGRPSVPESSVKVLIGGGAAAMVRRALERTGGAVPPERFERMWRHFLDLYEARCADRSTVWPGAVEALERAAAAGARLGLCTNKIARLTACVLAGLGLAKYFPVVVAGDTLAVQKPHPAPLLEAVRRLGGDPRRSIMIGDSEADIAAASAAGLKSICVTFGYSPKPCAELGASRLIADYGELPGAVASLLRG